MIKKILISIIILLIPIYKISFEKETNFIMPEEEKKIIYINFNNMQLELDDYVYHVVSAEVPASFEKEAIKAQILATRTYTYNKIISNPNFIFSNNDQAFNTEEELKNKWQNKYEEYELKIKKLINETKDEIITYNNEPIKAYYFSMSNGYTSSVMPVFGTNEEYLQSVESSYEKNLKNYQVTKEISIEYIADILDIKTPLLITNIKRDNSNRVISITINNQEYSGTDFRKKFNLRSTDFLIKIENNKAIITTTGYGHGVGMSQYGANEMAKQGYSYQEILKYYYINTEISKISA